MWDVLKIICQGSEKMLENRLSIVCTKLDDFKMLPGETIEKMKNRFMEIVLEIALVKPNKYTLHELNLKVMRALPASWHVYTALHPGQPGFNTLTTEEIFNLLTGNEYEMICLHGFAYGLTGSKKHDSEKK